MSSPLFEVIRIMRKKKHNALGSALKKIKTKYPNESYNTSTYTKMKQ
jgi:hypothetical protein